MVRAAPPCAPRVARQGTRRENGKPHDIWRSSLFVGSSYAAAERRAAGAGSRWLSHECEITRVHASPPLPGRIVPNDGLAGPVTPQEHAIFVISLHRNWKPRSPTRHCTVSGVFFVNAQKNASDGRRWLSHSVTSPSRSACLPPGRSSFASGGSSAAVTILVRVQEEHPSRMQACLLCDCQ